MVSRDKAMLGGGNGGLDQVGSDRGEGSMS